MRKSMLILTLAVALIAAACGDDADTTVGNAPDTNAPDTTAPDTTAPDTTAPDTSDTTAPDTTAPDTTAPDTSDPDTSDPDTEPLGAGPYPIADITITVTLDVGVDPFTHQISCLGDTATIIGAATDRSDAICLRLNDPAVRERLVNGPATDVACTEQYGGPEVAAITGTLEGEPIDTSLNRADGCGIADWDLLGRILPTT